MTDADVRKELAPEGRLRAAINLGNPVLAQRGKAGGEPTGVSVDLARQVARRLSVGIELVPFDQAGRAFEALSSGTCTLGFLAVDPKRAERLFFTAPYVEIEGSYLVAADAPFQSTDDVDRSSVRIGVMKDAAYELYLARSLRHALLVYGASPLAGFEALARREIDAVAGIRQALTSYAKEHADTRVLPGRFMAIEQAMTTAASNKAASAYLSGLIAEMKANGFVRDSLRRSGQDDVSIPA